MDSQFTDVITTKFKVITYTQIDRDTDTTYRQTEIQTQLHRDTHAHTHTP